MDRPKENRPRPAHLDTVCKCLFMWSKSATPQKPVAATARPWNSHMTSTVEGRAKPSQANLLLQPPYT